MRVLFLLTAALILYGSFYPWRFYDRELPASPLWILLHAWPPSLSGIFLRDAILNFFLYIPLGATGYLALRGQQPAWLRFAVPLLAGAGLCVAVELGQLYALTRSTSMLDVVMNTSGTAAGVVLATLVPVETAWARRLRSCPDGLLLMALWACWQVFPVLPALTRSALARKLTVLLQSRLELQDVLTHLFAWLVLACLAQRMLPGLPSALTLALLTALVPAKFVIYSRFAGWSEFAGTAAAILLWIVWLRRVPWRLYFIAAGGVLTLVMRELLPFRWLQRPAVFFWIPFEASLESAPLTGMMIVFEKLFTYAAVVWLLWRCGVRLRWSAAAVAVLLLGFEVLQRHIAFRVPETTDSVLALLSAVLFAAVRRGGGEKQ